MKQAADDRNIVAPDYSGYGESDLPSAQPPVSIKDYTLSIWEVVDALLSGPVNLLGYHIGPEVEAETARQWLSNPNGRC